MAAAERLQCDMVIAMGLVKKVVLSAACALIRWLMGRRSSVNVGCCLISLVQRWRAGVRSHCTWYTLDNFLTALKKKFANVNLLSQDAAGHSLLLCEK